MISLADEMELKVGLYLYSEWGQQKYIVVDRGIISVLNFCGVLVNQMGRCDMNSSE